jgi:hypothetical protein
MQYINIPREIAQRAKGFVGRTWVSDQVLEWFERGTERYFLLTGEPGSGKTALAAWLVGAGPAPENAGSKDRLARVRSAWSAGHFCVGRTQGETINPSRFASALAQQLSDRISSFWSPSICSAGTLLTILGATITDLSSPQSGFRPSQRSEISLKRVVRKVILPRQRSMIADGVLNEPEKRRSRQ